MKGKKKPPIRRFASQSSGGKREQKYLGRERVGLNKQRGRSLCYCALLLLRTR